ncbi:hypothetical protein BABINDRAFT_162042 [Babjeviella inositovora NRRL Y-12698]|uniref:Uncharacterized protein n=1 Tax=Babjeviella inositovora NRRL Y-12698 TaxID=984486 RepID=A0A1E3QML3_9ASCO|nr:uncharacterized protein BABINDRAFT_162042 [Babjeviella inositovora NRRL Y-12698]ODQ78956.1 hypothetical protein BABINDRAFT_162042 [Babjeviella inositovora NRRL Y-12698]
MPGMKRGRTQSYTWAAGAQNAVDWELGTAYHAFLKNDKRERNLKVGKDLLVTV